MSKAIHKVRARGELELLLKINISSRDEYRPFWGSLVSFDSVQCLASETSTRRRIGPGVGEVDCAQQCEPRGFVGRNHIDFLIMTGVNHNLH